MKKVILGFVALMSVSSFASSKEFCKQAFVQHYERVSLIRELLKTGELTEEQFESRLEDSNTVLEVSLPAMCKNISASKQTFLKAEAIAEVNHL